MTAPPALDAETVRFLVRKGWSAAMIGRAYGCGAPAVRAVLAGPEPAPEPASPAFAGAGLEPAPAANPSSDGRSRQTREHLAARVFAVLAAAETGLGVSAVARALGREFEVVSVAGRLAELLRRGLVRRGGRKRTWNAAGYVYRATAAGRAWYAALPADRAARAAARQLAAGEAVMGAAAQYAAVAAVLREAAVAGAPCPATASLAAAIGAPERNHRAVNEMLSRAGLKHGFVIERRGEMARDRRVVFADGAASGWTDRSRKPQHGVGPAPDEAARAAALCRGRTRLPAMDLPAASRTAHLEARAGTCQWIEGDPGDGPRAYRFCGAPAVRPGASWCAAHHAVVWGGAQDVERTEADRKRRGWGPKPGRPLAVILIGLDVAPAGGDLGPALGPLARGGKGGE